MGHLGSDGKPFDAAELKRLKKALLLLSHTLQHSPEPASAALGPDLLRNWHVVLCAGIERMQPGQFRRHDITFGSFMGTPPERITAEVLMLAQRHHEVLPELGASTPAGLEHATWVHAELLRIHPFWDGNGRLARAVQAWLCWRLGTVPPAYTDRPAYLAGLNRYHHTRDLTLLMDVTREAQQHGRAP